MRKFTAKVENVDPVNGLQVRILENDTVGFIPCDEISRMPVRNLSVYERKVLEVEALAERFPGDLPMYSARAVDNENFGRICAAYENGERNTYPASLQFIPQGGKIAVYELAQGVTGAVPLSQFCLNRLESFETFQPPEKISVTITGISEGRITLSTIASFGSFEENVQELGLQVQDVVEGFALNWLPNRSGVLVMLAPNLTTVLDWAPLQKAVRVKIAFIDWERKKIKASFVEEIPPEDSRPIPFARFVRPPEGDMVDSLAFANANKVQKSERTTAPVPVEKPKAPAEPPAFELTSPFSPLKIFEDEAVVLDTSLHFASLDSGVSSGRLTREHADLAAVVDTLKFTSVYLLERYLYLKNRQCEYNRDTLNKMLETLCKYQVLCRFQYRNQNGEGGGNMYIYTRGRNYRRFAGSYQSYHFQILKNGDESSYSKGRLAVNQMLIGLMKNYEEVETNPLHKFEACDGDDRPLFCCYRIQTAELGTCFPESCRAGYEDRLAERLLRYHLRAKDMTFSVLITFEDQSQAERFAERVREMNLGYRVCITYDLNCFNKGFTAVIPPKKTDSGKWTSLLHRFKGFGSLIS